MCKLLTENLLNGGDTQNVAELPYEAAAPSETVVQETIKFADSEGGEAVVFKPSDLSGYDNAGITSLSLGSFASRPVLIDSFSWAEGAFFQHVFDPWTLVMSNPTILKKLDNYALIRCNLKLKFVVSASPFYYGLGMISYNPRQDSHPGAQIVIASDEQLVTYSQRPHIFIHPSSSAGGEMTLPFFHPHNWLRNRSAQIAEMGRITYSSPTTLRNANSVAGANVTVRCYGWLENVELSAPSVVLQGKRSKKTSRKPRKSKPSFQENMGRFASGRDEYGSGPVSNVASAVANAGAALSNVPVIGPFARATEIGAGALSRVASWFGYTNIPVISDVQPFKDLPFGGFASSEIGAPTPKLTLDPKNELTLDSRTVGLDGTDELSMESFVTRESYLDTFDWDTTDAPGASLWATGVSPSQMYRQDGLKIWSTPMAHACTLYKYWTGSVIYRFRIVATPYHRGRIKFQFEPSNANAPGGAGDETANITRIYDIGETQDIEICVPYMQPTAFMPTYRRTTAVTPVIFSSVGGFANIVGHNGSLSISVSNELSSPVANAPVSVSVFVRAGDDFKLMSPQSPPHLEEWISQSATELKCDSMGDTDESEPEVNLVYGGETALSLRQLLHRHCYTRAFAMQGALTEYTSRFYLYPLSLNTVDDVRNIHTSGVNEFNYVHNSFESWLAPCFAGKRGSMYWSMNTVGDKDQAGISWWRDFVIPTVAKYDSTESITTANDNPSEKSYATLSGVGPQHAGNGLALTNIKTQIGATVLVPFISTRRFVHTFPSPFLTATTVRPGVEDCVVGAKYASDGVATDEPRVHGEYYCATGPDYNLFFFTGVPTILLIPSIPVIP